MQNKPAHLYRLYDGEGYLLYVGISLSAIARLAEHQQDKDWFGDVRKVEIEPHRNRRDADSRRRESTTA